MCYEVPYKTYTRSDFTKDMAQRRHSLQVCPMYQRAAASPLGVWRKRVKPKTQAENAEK